MGALLFRHRARVMAAWFACAVAAAWAGVRIAAESAAWWAAPAWRLWGEEMPPRITMGMTGLLCLAAFVLRVAGEARLGRAVFGQGETARLVDDGPFGWTRNPLYTGTWIFFSATIFVWTPALAWVVLAGVFAWMLDAIVRHEETLLSTSLGQPYRDYLGRVPRWFPRRPTHATGAVAAGPPLVPLALGNLGLLSMGAYRLAVAAGVAGKAAGAANLACVATWLVVIALRRWRATRADATPA